MNITIRKATEKDFATIQKLNSDLFVSDSANDDALNLNWPTSKGGVAYYFQKLRKPNYVALLAEDENHKILGYAIGNSKNKFSYRTVKTGELENMFVVSEARRMGIGGKLIAELARRMKKKGVDRLYVSAFIKNTGGISFYQSVGFAPWELGLEMKLKE